VLEECALARARAVAPDTRETLQGAARVAGVDHRAGEPPEAGVAAPAERVLTEELVEVHVGFDLGEV
jgi:hypothetical protein